MSRKSIWFLASFSAIALTALIFVQLIWINDGIEVQEKQFDQLINQGLSDIVNKLEEYETLNYLEEELEKEEQNAPVQDDIIAKEPREKPRSTTLGLGSDEDNHALFSEDPYGFFQEYDVISGDTMVLLSGSSLYDVNRSPSHSRTVITQSDLVQNYERFYANKRVFVERVFNRMVRYEGAIDNRLSKVMLDTVVQKEISGLGVDLPYEYAVKTATGEYVLTSSEFNPAPEEKMYTSLLYPQDLITTPNFLMVYFIGQQNYIFKSVSLMAGISLILIIFLLIISFIAIYVIVRQKKLSEIKNDFVNNMTHELKTPISTISLASQMLSDTSLSADKKNTDNISRLLKEESKRLGMQVEKVLQMSIFDQGRMQLKIKSIDPEILIRRVLDSFSLQFKNSQVQLTLNLDFSGKSIEGDDTHLSNVFSNLIDNALKYSSEQPIIQVSSSYNRKGIFICIQDNGIGMTMENRKRIFEKFYRVPQGNIHTVKGFGLGLSYVKKIVDQHHGRITVDSELKKGSEFTVFLPYYQDKQHGQN